jgi:Cdc6-like AAA superfamily ATPase
MLCESSVLLKEILAFFLASISSLIALVVYSFKRNSQLKQILKATRKEAKKHDAIRKKQLDIAARPAADRDKLLDRMRKGKL